MGHIGLEFGGIIDPQDGEDVYLSANFINSRDIWRNPQILLKNANPNVKILSEENSRKISLI